MNPQIHLADRNGTGLWHTKYKGVSQFPDTNSWHVAMWWPSRWCIMSNSKHSEARRGEWPTQDAVWCKTCIPLYLCTLTPWRTPLPAKPAQDNSEESAKQKQTCDDQFLLRLIISDHHTNNGWVEMENLHTRWKKRSGFSCFISRLTNFLCTWKWMSRRILMSSVEIFCTGYHN